MEIVSTVHHNSPSRLRAKSPLWQPFCYSSALHWGQKINSRHLRKFLRIVCKLSVSIMSCCSWLGLWFYMSVETAPWVKLLTAPGCHRWGACWGTEQHFVNSWQNLNRWSYGLWNEMVLKCAASPAHLLATGRGGSDTDEQLPSWEVILTCTLLCRQQEKMHPQEITNLTGRVVFHQQWAALPVCSSGRTELKQDKKKSCRGKTVSKALNTQHRREQVDTDCDETFCFLQCLAFLNMSWWLWFPLLHCSIKE